MKTARVPLCAVAIVVAASACGGGGDRRADTPASAPIAATSPARPRIVVLGDSLTAGLGLLPGDAYPALLQRRLDAEGLAFEVVNAGVSGDTSAGGLRRVRWALEGDVRVLVVALGGNDGLRGLPIGELRKNLEGIIEAGQSNGVRVILAGMEAPPNVGPEYTTAFHRVYVDLSREHDIPLIPFLLDGVAGVPSLNQRDGMHPTAEGARRVADIVWPVLRQTIVGSSGS